MAIDSFSNLKASVTAFSGRDDLSNQLDDFVQLAETKIYANQVNPLRVRAMEDTATDTLSTASRYLALPTDFLEMRSFRITINDYQPTLDPVVPNSLRIYPSVGRPTEYTVTDQIEFNMIPDAAYTVTFQYYKKLAPLSSAAPVNAILTSFPNIYLYGALAELNKFAAEEEKATYYEDLFFDAISGANRESVAGSYGPAPRARKSGSTP